MNSAFRLGSHMETARANWPHRSLLRMCTIHTELQVPAIGLTEPWHCRNLRNPAAIGRALLLSIFLCKTKWMPSYIYAFIWKAKLRGNRRKTGMERKLCSTGSFFKHLLRLGLYQAKERTAKLHAGLPCGWRRFRTSDIFHCLLRYVSKEMGWQRCS